MNIVFLLAGRGSRFKEEGYTEPKPLIDMLAAPMYTWAVLSLSRIKKSQYIFLLLKEHADKGLSEDIQARFGKKSTIVIIDRVTQGAAETALFAQKYIDTSEDLIISNGDQYFESPEFFEKISLSRKNFTGLIPVFEATHPRWSFAKTNEKNKIIEVAEKVPISNNATVGVYYFKKGSDFVWAAKEMIRKDIRRNNEFYICPVFNELIGRGDSTYAVPASSMWSMGTPEDVVYFKKYFQQKST